MATSKAQKTRATRVAHGLFGLTLGAAAAFACGPSLTSVHEGTVRFEHCNRLDLDEHIVKKECGQCWSTWIADYSYGQPRDRIDYARRRARALANGDDSRPILKFDEHAPEERQFYLVVPGPTSVRTPPPPIATVWQGADAGAMAKTTGDRPPAESCADDCRSTWQTCSTPCANGNGQANGNGKSNVARAGSGGATNGNGKHAPSASSCSKCGLEYSNCMKRCFE